MVNGNMTKKTKIKADSSQSPLRPLISARDQGEEEEEINPLILSPSAATGYSLENNSGTKIKKKKHKSPLKATLRPMLKSLPVHHLKRKCSSKSLTNNDGLVSVGDQRHTSIDVRKDETNTVLSTSYATMPPPTTDHEEMINFAQFDAAEMGTYESLGTLPPTKYESATVDGHVSQIKEEFRHSARSYISEASNHSLGNFLTGLKNPLSSIKRGFSGPPWLRTGKQPQRSGEELWALARSRLPDITMMHLNSMDNEDPEGDIGESVAAGMDIKFSTCICGILLYLILGTVFYSFVFERWSIVDSLYFSVVTFTTVGYGDYTPSTHTARLFTSAFAVMGISFLGLALGVIADKILAMQLETVNKEMSDRNASEVLKVFGSGQTPSNVAVPIQDRSAGAVLHDASRKLEKEELSCWSGLRYYAPVVVLLFGGSAVIGWTEGWNWSQAIYYCTITTTTIGYGDFVPTTPATRLFAVFYVPIAVGVMGNILGGVASFVMERKRQAMLQKIKDRRLRVKDLLAMDEDGDGNVTEFEYLKFMLLKMQKVDEELLDELHNQFSHFDADDSGVLAKSDLYEMAKRRSKELDVKLRLSGYKTFLMQVAKNDYGKIPNNSGERQVNFTDISAHLLEQGAAAKNKS